MKIIRDMLFDGPLIKIAKAKLDALDSTGINIRHTTEFESLKVEVHQGLLPTSISTVNWSHVAQQATRILETQSKDVLVAVYLARAWMELYQTKGWLEALDFLNVLAKKFGLQLQPDGRVKAHVAAFSWLADQCVNVLFGKIVALTDVRYFLTLQATLVELDASMQQSYGQEIFSVVRRGVRERLMELQTEVRPPVATAVEPPLSVAPMETLAVSEPLPSEPSPAIETPAVDISELPALLLRSSDELLRANIADPRAYYYRRTALWGALTELPPHDRNQRTDIVAPAEPVRQRLLLLAQSDSPEQTLLELERLFTTHPYWLDVQQVLTSISGAFPKYQAIAAIVAQHTVLLLQQFPESLSLTFADGTPWCSTQTQQWLRWLSSSRAVEDSTLQAQLITDIETVIERATSAREKWLAMRKKDQN